MMFASASNGKVADSSTGKTERQGRRSAGPLRVLRSAIGSLTLAAALMAVMNVETVWQSYEWQSHPSQSQAAHRGNRLVSRIVSKKGPNITGELKTSFQNDELNSLNPYASMMTSDPLDQIAQRGVAHFTREALRSPSYAGDSGYDMVYYNIEQADESHSTVLAYLESGKTPFVIVHHLSKDQLSEYYFFRDGLLVPQSELNSQEVEALIAQRVNSGIPLLTMSR